MTNDQIIMLRNSLLIIITLCSSCVFAQNKPATISESKKVFTTYGFSDPDPIADVGKFYPYYRFDGYTNTPAQREWKIIELENDFIKLMVLPEIGGKIWAAWDKATGKPFIYYNQVVKFRDVAMRGPWTSGGIEANYGIIGHTPNCATPMDYLTKKNADGSVSCFIGTLDLLTQTYWSIEINLPKDKAYFTTRSFWNNSTSIEQPYYTWMNVGMPSKGNLEFVYPGNKYIGHSGEYSDWTINPEKNKDISFYENNDFGGPKSYHVIGKYSDFFGAYYHDQDFGMARYSLRDEKPGRKIWIWGLSRQGMIWEKLLTDNDGQYVEVQSGRLFNQASDGSNYSPFKQLGFAPHTTDEWTEYWFPVKGTKGFVKANPYGALNLRAGKSSITIDFMSLQNIDDELEIFDNGKPLHSRNIKLDGLKTFTETIPFNGNIDNITVTLGGTKMRYHADPKHGILSRPVASPENFDWKSVFGLYTLGKEFIQQRYYPLAEEKLKEVLAKDPNYLPALSDLAMISYRNLDYKKALEYATRALSIDTYDPAGNFYYGLANASIGNTTDAKDGFDIASLSPSYRGAAYTELSKLYFRENDLDKAEHYSEKALENNSANTAALQILAALNRTWNKRSEADKALGKLEELMPLNHTIRFEKYLREKTEANKMAFVNTVQNEMRHETFLQLADWYESLGLTKDALEVLNLAPGHPEIYYRSAWFNDRLNRGSGKDFIEKANRISPSLVFPFRASSAETLEWVVEDSDDWKPRYYLALIHWSRNNTERARQLLAECGQPDFAPFYAVRAELFKDDRFVEDLKRAAQLDPKQWRYGKMLADHYIAVKDYRAALQIATQYDKSFPNDFRLQMMLAKTLLLNGQYKATTDLLNKTNILPYEGATDGRQLYREAWLMQGVEHLRKKDMKSALAAIGKAKLWPENLGAGKPYDDMIDLRLEHYLEALAFEAGNQQKRAKEKLNEIVNAQPSRRHQITDLVTALALKKTGHSEEGEKLLKEWLEKQPQNAMAKWAYAVYNGQKPGLVEEGNDNFRIIRSLSEINK